MKYLLSGYYGMANLGDDILLYVTLSEVSQIDASAKFTIISQRPLVLPESTAVCIKPQGRLRTVRELLKHDIWLFGGGGIIQDYNAGSLHSLIKTYRLAKIAKLLGRKIVMIGIGIGPLETKEGRIVAKKLLGTADFLTVRDLNSGAIASQLGLPNVNITGDLALLLQLPDVAETVSSSPDGMKVLGLSVLPLYANRGRPRGQDRQVAENFAWAINKVLDESSDWVVKLFEIHGGSTSYSDRAVLSILQDQSKYPHRILYCHYDPNIFRMISEIKRCDAFIAMRLHASILAYRFNIPFLMVGYHPKCLGFAEMIGYPIDQIMSAQDLQNRELLYQSITKL
ncbi:MAG: polysaccharide pyruvyl transferase family protein, partial [Candidatus Methanomethylicaceae archaeon]